MKQDIMLVSPCKETAMPVCKLLQRFDIGATWVEDIDRAKAELALHSPAFVLIDTDMGNAKRFLREIAVELFSPPPYVIVASTFVNPLDRAAALDFGADVCIEKPISGLEVVSIIDAVLRRERKIARRSVGRMLSCIDYKDLSIDPLRHTVVMKGKPVKLTTGEFEILYLLADHKGTALSKEDICQALWDIKCYLSANNIPGHIFSLRQKLGLSSKETDYIQTVFGVGYRFGC